MNIIEINKQNLAQEHICCAIGNDLENKLRAQTKKDWLASQFENGLVFKRLDERGKVFIEYMPIEKVWKPIIGSNCMVINCLWVSGQFKGKGFSTQLLDKCIEDAKKQKMNGIAVVSSNKVKPFLTDKKFYLKHGFKVIDTAEPYFELLYLELNPNAAKPKFAEIAKLGISEVKKGFAFYFSNQCPFMEVYVYKLAEVLKAKCIDFKIVKIENSTDAQKSPSAFGTLGIFYNGKFVSHELMTEKKFEELVDKIMNNK